jgi:ribosome maturation factor RimP
VRIRVVGSSLEPLSAKYTLEVSSQGANSNRSTQSGLVQLVPGVEVTMVTMTLRSRGQGWTARLTVEPENAPAYEELKTST